MSQQAAFTAAQIKAERAIMQLRTENVEIAEKTDTFTVDTEKTNGLIESYTEENIERRQTAATQGSLKGSKVLKRWKQNHPVTGRPVVGMVVSWSPSSADFARDMKETLDQDPESGGAGYNPSQVDAKEVESGSSIGDDDEDDF